MPVRDVRRKSSPFMWRRTAEHRAIKEVQDAQDAQDAQNRADEIARETAAIAARYYATLRKNSQTDLTERKTVLSIEENMQKRIAEIKARRKMGATEKDAIPSEFREGGGGSRRNKATPKPKAKPQHDDMTMKDIKEMCKANLIKLSKVVEGKRVVFNKKELITKLKRKKLL
jgi:hypothetical protein